MRQNEQGRLGDLSPLRPRRALVHLGVLVASSILAVAGLAQAGVLAPNLRTTQTGGGGSGIYTAGSVSLENVSWRAWTVTAIRAPVSPDLTQVEVRIAVLRHASQTESVVEAWEGVPGAATGIAPASLPASVPRGWVLLVYVRAAARQVCPNTPPGSSARPIGIQSRVTRPVLSISTPLGTRHIRPSMWVSPCHY